MVRGLCLLEPFSGETPPAHLDLKRACGVFVFDLFMSGKGLHGMEGWTIRECAREEWPQFAGHVRAMWREMGAAEYQIKPRWQEEILRFMERAAETGQFRGYAAVQNGQIVGSAGGQIFAGLSPALLTADYRQIGYIWGVYVRPEWRGLGMASALTQTLVEYLHALGCSQVRLHASPAGRPVYEKLGFLPSTEMRILLPRAGEAAYAT